MVAIDVAQFQVSCLCDRINILVCTTGNLIFLPDAIDNVVIYDTNRMSDESSVANVVFTVTIEILDFILVP